MYEYVFAIITIPIGIFFTALGIYSMNRKKPMWFWSGTTVNEEEIKDIHSYNKENGIMWIVYSIIYYAGGIASLYIENIGGVIVLAGSLIGTPLLIVAYEHILKKYRR